MFLPKLEILPKAQRLLWEEMSTTPAMFTLYGGTAIALRLGHRFSIDFDFFSQLAFVPHELQREIPYLADSVLRQSAPNTLTVTVERGAPVQLSYFGKLRIGQVAAPESVKGPGFAVASLIDLAGMKVSAVTQRAELKDYLDIHALLTLAKIPLSAMLAAASVIYGNMFNPLISLKAITYHDDSALEHLPKSIRTDLISAARGVDLAKLPTLDAVRLREAMP